MRSTSLALHVEEVDPNFMMATLIAFPETLRVVGNGEGTMVADLPIGIGAWRLQEPKTIHLVHLLDPTMVKGQVAMASS